MTPLLRAAQVAELLNVSEWFVLEHARRGDIPHRKIGGRIRFTPEDVAAYIDRAARAQQQPEKPSRRAGSGTQVPPPAVLQGLRPTRARKARPA